MVRMVTVGADPEFPVLTQGNPSRLGGTKYVPACGLIGGDKGKPIMADPEEGGWLEDGVMVELNPKHSTDPRQVNHRIALLHQRVVDILKPKKLSVTIRDVGWYDVDVLKGHPKALEFGCMPDLTAYEMGQERNVPMPAAMATYGESIRFAGGHVHLGVTDWPKDLPKFIAVRFLDLLLWKPAIQQWRLQSTERTGYYGLPGLYRDTPYGLEYRTPSNYWTKEAIVDGEAWFLGRLKAIGNVFAEFETYKEGLVKLYNNIDWNLFQDGMATHDFDRIYDAIPVEVHGNTNQVEFGPYMMDLRNHAVIRDINWDRLIDPIMGMINEPPGNRDRFEVLFDPAAFLRAREMMGEAVVPPAHVRWVEENERIDELVEGLFPDDREEDEIHDGE